MAERAECKVCDRMFKDEAGLRAHNAAKHPEGISENKFPFKKITNWGIFTIVAIGVVLGVVWLVGNIENLPPTDMQGHVEENPPSHVLKEPMPMAIQKHMLEHADGTGPPGIVINYNCDDYECEEGLIENLEEFASVYTANVYVAPFKGMDAKIALTKLGKLEVLEEYDKAKIENFIGRM